MTVPLSAVFRTDDLTATRAVIAAVSGGSDSLAMLFLLREHLVCGGGRQKLIAVTVDHGLRAGSAQEAETVARLCARYGIAHETLVWYGEKPDTAMPHRARLARYDLLCQAAAKHAASVIITGHTLDDQAETYIMRVRRGSGRGLAAMSRVSLLHERFVLLRPLLGVRRQTLRRYLAGRGLTWIEDPSNDDPRYERVRVRRCLDDETVMQAVHAVSAAARRRQAEAEAAAVLARKLRLRLRGERLWLDLSQCGADDALGLTALVATGAAIMGGDQYPVANRQKLLAFITEKNRGLRRMTLSGAVIEATGALLRIWREKRNLAVALLQPGQSLVWDGRYRISNGSRSTVSVRPPARDELRQFLLAMPSDRDEDRDLHVPALETTCMICGADGIDMPALTARLTANRDIGVQRILSPFDWLVSGHDLAIFDAFRAVLAMKAGKIIKSSMNSHELRRLILATVESELMLHENLSGAFASSAGTALT